MLYRADKSHYEKYVSIKGSCIDYNDMKKKISADVLILLYISAVN